MVNIFPIKEKNLSIVIIALATIFAACSRNSPDTSGINNPIITDSITISYIADSVSIFPNPERGWYASQGFTPPGGGIPGNNDTPHEPVTLAALQTVKSNGATVYRDDVLVGNMTGDIPQSRLDQISADLAACRQAGMKVVWHPCYHWGMVEPSPGPDEPTLMRHLEQLGVILRANADVILNVTAGLYGGTGEPVKDQQLYAVEDHDSWQAISAKGIRGYIKLLTELPQDRMVTFRYGRFKWDFFGWDTGGVPGAITGIGTAGTNAVNLTAANAFDGSNQARIGFENQSFLGDAYSWATYTQPNEKTFCAIETNYTPQTGEVSLATAVNMNGANVVAEMALHHYTSFNFDVSEENGGAVYAAWKKDGAYEVISRRLGYRFRLIGATLPKTAASDAVFKMTMKIANDGWARIMNPRKVEIIFKNKTTNDKYVMDIDGDGRGNRLWLPGPGETKTLQISKALPTGIPSGEYDLFLNLPDPYSSLHDRPEYSIRLANKEIWNEATGYNSLLCAITVK